MAELELDTEKLDNAALAILSLTLHDGNGVWRGLPTQMLALFRLLIEQSVKHDPVLKNQEIEAQTGRPPNQIVRDLRSALVSCGLPGEQTKTLIATVRARGYRLGLDPAEVAIEP